MLVITDGISTEQNILFFTYFSYHLPTKYLRKCSVGNFRAICRCQLLGTIYRQNTYGKLPTEVFRR